MESSQVQCKVTVSSPSEAVRGLSIEVPNDLLADRCNSKIKKVSTSAHIKGFRPGKAPTKVIQEQYGQGIRMEVVEELASNAINTTADENKWQVVSRPVITDVKGFDSDTVVVEARVEVMPEFELPAYRNLTIEAVQVQFEQKLADEALERLLKQHAKEETLTGRDVVQRGDTVNVVSASRSLVEENAAVVEGEREFKLTLSEPDLSNEFIEKLAGAKIGDYVVTSPKREEGTAEEAIKNEYGVVVKSLVNVILPEFTDEFVKENKLGENTQAVLAEIESSLREQIAENNKGQVLENLAKEVLEKVQFEVPPTMLRREMMEIAKSRLGKQGNEENVKAFVAQFAEKLEKDASEKIRWSTVVGRIIDSEKFELSEEAWTEHLNKLARQFMGESASADDIRGMIEPGSEQEMNLRWQALYQAIIDDLVSSTTVVAKSPEKK